MDLKGLAGTSRDSQGLAGTQTHRNLQVLIGTRWVSEGNVEIHSYSQGLEGSLGYSKGFAGTHRDSQVLLGLTETCRDKQGPSGTHSELQGLAWSKGLPGTPNDWQGLTRTYKNSQVLTESCMDSQGFA